MNTDDGPKQSAFAWLPNALTLARAPLGVLAALGWWMWSAHFDAALGRGLGTPEAATLERAAWTAWTIGFGALALGGLFDLLDGWLARALDAVSRFGALMDPIADKIFVGTVLIALAFAPALRDLGPVIWGPAAVIIVRDVLMTLHRLFRPSPAFAVTGLAKFKTAFEILAVALPFVIVTFAPPIPGERNAVGYITLWVWNAWLILLWCAAALSVYTGLAYRKAAIDAARAAADG